MSRSVCWTPIPTSAPRWRWSAAHGAERALVVSTCCLQVRAWEASRTAGAGGAAIVLEGGCFCAS